MFDAERATRIYDACSKYMLGYDAFAIIQQAYADDPDSKKAKEEKIKQIKNLETFEAELRRLLEEKPSKVQTTALITLDYSEYESEHWVENRQTLMAIQKNHPETVKIINATWPLITIAVPCFADETSEEVITLFKVSSPGKAVYYSKISAIICRDDNTYLWKKHVSHCDADLVSMAVKENPELLQMQNLRKIDKYITKNIARWEK